MSWFQGSGFVGTKTYGRTMNMGASFVRIGLGDMKGPETK